MKVLLSFLLFCHFQVSFAEDIILGSSLPLSGPAEGLGVELKAGYEEYFSKIVETLPAPITRESFVKAASTFKADLEGLSVEFSRGGNQALGKVYLTKISGGKIQSLE